MIKERIVILVDRSIYDPKDIRTENREWIFRWFGNMDHSLYNIFDNTYDVYMFRGHDDK